MGGTISVESELGRGTAFTFDIEYGCVDLVSIQPKPETPVDYSRLAGLHVLLCEDHPLNQEIAAALLGEKGMKDRFAFFAQRSAPLLVLLVLAASLAIFLVCLLLDGLRLALFRLTGVDRFCARVTERFQKEAGDPG